MEVSPQETDAEISGLNSGSKNGGPDRQGKEAQKEVQIPMRGAVPPHTKIQTYDFGGAHGCHGKTTQVLFNGNERSVAGSYSSVAALGECTQLPAARLKCSKKLKGGGCPKLDEIQWNLGA